MKELSTCMSACILNISGARNVRTVTTKSNAQYGCKT